MGFALRQQGLRRRPRTLPRILYRPLTEAPSKHPAARKPAIWEGLTLRSQNSRDLIRSFERDTRKRESFFEHRLTISSAKGLEGALPAVLYARQSLIRARAPSRKADSSSRLAFQRHCKGQKCKLRLSESCLAKRGLACSKELSRDCPPRLLLPDLYTLRRLQSRR